VGALIPLLMALGVQTAETLPPGTSAVYFGGGVLVLGIQVPVVPVLPIFTLDAEAGWGLGDGLDLRARYRTYAGLAHRAGPEVRGRVLKSGAFSAALRIWPNAAFAGARQEELDVGGDVATLFGGLATWRAPWGALTAEAGLQVEWLLYEKVGDQTSVDTTPFPAFVELALVGERRLHDDVTLSLRLEYARPLAPDDPFVVLGGYPRLLFGGAFAL
jgi:hypothetical protein